jgi:superfamily I DNA/RNA helicase
MFTPTPQQQKIIDHFDGHALVVSGPGSGKTVTLIAHVKKLVLERNISPDDIWVMAFNRDISSKLREKIQIELGEKSPQTTTIHTFILSQTLRHGAQLLNGFEIAEGLREYGKRCLLWRPILERLKEKHGVKETSQGKRLTIHYVKNRLWDQLRDYWLTDQEPDDDLFAKFKFEIERIKEIYKIVFLDELAIKFLDALKANPSFRKDVAKPRIVIDEFQDLNPTEHGILHQFHEEGTIFMVLGDDDQAVNDFRRAHADYIRDFAEIYHPIPYPLARDRRCPKEILDLADKFVKGLPRFEKSPGYAPHKGKVNIVNFPNDEDEKSGVVNIVKKYLSLFSGYNENPQILILSGTTGKVKGRSRISEVIDALNEAGIDDITGEKKEDPLDNEWGLAFKSLSTMLVKGLSPMNLAAWLSVTDFPLMKKVNKYIEEKERRGNQVDFLKAIVDLKPKDKDVEKLLSDIDSLKEKVEDERFDPKIIMDFMPGTLNARDEAELLINKVWEESQKANTIRDNNSNSTERRTSKGSKFLKLLGNYTTEYIKKPEIGRIHVTTYRKAKGLEADLVMVTSIDSSDFSNEPQKRRLLYVAATRSKKNLVLSFASKRSGARRFTRGRAEKFRGVPKVYRSPIIPSNYCTQEYSEGWLNDWEPI